MQAETLTPTWAVRRQFRPSAQGTFQCTFHALQRMQSRRIPQAVVGQVLTYGRVAYVRGACIYAVGNREVAYWRARGVRLDAASGVQVVVDPGTGWVLTCFRNADLRSLRRKQRYRYTMPEDRGFPDNRCRPFPRIFRIVSCCLLYVWMHRHGRNYLCVSSH